MSFGLEGLNVNQMTSAASALSTDASKYVNDASLEMQWAMKAYHHAETYFNLLCSVDSSLLKLTNKDDEIYKNFRQAFPNMAIDVLKEDELKTTDAKSTWRPFVQSYEGEVEDYNFGTLVRKDCTGDISDDNTVLVLRIQFLAIEIARNREGLNAAVKEKVKKQKEESSS
ncbi:protein PBDC1-like [Mizuhopecten yessoensis]|uniref:protein PBDC1-like n=1 Tax=Mizuhopecten yessoensis TaxID=6573 RepID=UPI000B45C1FD|nr:protein PBDC1-like [Mizuhopecten yessoensis]